MAFLLPREDNDPDDGFSMWIGNFQFVGVNNRNAYWHIMYVIHKGGIEALRRQSAHALHDALASLVPFLADRIRELVHPDELNVLDVAVNRLRRWHHPGLLLIGDAAHAMSPLYGVGVDLAVQDAVATANLLTRHLRRWQEHGVPVPPRALGAVQRRRMLPTIITQIVQWLVQRGGIDQPCAIPTGRHRACSPGRPITAR